MRGKIIAQSDSTVNAHPAILTSWNGDGTGCIVFFGVIFLRTTASHPR
jgi:hypothetical protein